MKKIIKWINQIEELINIKLKASTVIIIALLIGLIGSTIGYKFLEMNNKKEKDALVEEYEKKIEELLDLVRPVPDIPDDIYLVSKNVYAAVKTCAKLVNSEYIFSEIVEKKENSEKWLNFIPVPFSAREMLVAYKGHISVGISDLNEIVVKVDESKGCVEVVLPSLDMIEAVIDDIKYYDIKKNIWETADADFLNQNTKEREAYIDLHKNELLENTEFWTFAKKNMFDLINSYIDTFGYGEIVTVRFE